MAKLPTPKTTPPGISPEAYAATLAALDKNASQAAPAKPASGKFFLPGFKLVLPIEAQFGFTLLQRELSAIPPKHFADNERQSLNTALESLARDVAKYGVSPATSASCKKLIADVRRQAKICAARAHTADIKTDSEIRLKEAERQARAEKRAAARETEYKGDGTPSDLAKINAALTLHSASVGIPATTRAQNNAARRSARKARKAAALEADRPWEK